MKREDLEKNVVSHVRGLKTVFQMQEVLGEGYNVEQLEILLKTLDMFKIDVQNALENKKNK